VITRFKILDQGISIKGKISKSTPTKSIPVKKPNLQIGWSVITTMESLLRKHWNLGRRGFKHLRRKITII